MFSRIAFAILLTLSPIFSWARVRTVEVKKDQIVHVKTSLGVATIVQVPDRPNSLVVGDQNAFKVEYLDQAITIKPLHGSARSNLYIYTDYRRFNVQLVTSSEAAADYVVYLESPKEKPKTPKDGWRSYKNFLRNDSLTLETKRIARTIDGTLLIEFEVRSSLRETFKPEWLWLTQNGKPKSIHGLALSSQDLNSGRPLKGIIQVLSKDVSRENDLRIELRRKRTSYLTIPKRIAWK